MGVLVNITAQCLCNFGVSPLALVSANTTISAGGSLALNIMDIPKGNFGICNSPFNPAAVAAKATGATAPCMPSFIPPWFSMTPTKTLIANKPALHAACKLACALAGPPPTNYCISILPPGGSPTVQVN